MFLKKHYTTIGRYYNNWPYLCCPHKPRSVFSIWKMSPRPGWLWRGRCTQGTGWWRTCPCCPLTGASSGSVCEGLPGRCRWTGPRWRRSCERGQTHRSPREPAGHMLFRKKKSFCVILIFLSIFRNYIFFNKLHWGLSVHLKEIIPIFWGVLSLSSNILPVDNCSRWWYRPLQSHKEFDFSPLLEASKPSKTLIRWMS